MVQIEEGLIDFGASLVSHRETEDAVFALYANRIFHVTIKKGKKANMLVVSEGYKFLDEQGGGQYYNIFQFESFSDVDPEVRDWAADDTGNIYTHSDAIVISNFAQKILADFYLKFNRPVKPTKIFRDLKEAIEWTHSLINVV